MTVCFWYLVKSVMSSQRWKNLGVQKIIRTRRNVLADKNVREKIPTWLNDMLQAKIFPQLCPVYTCTEAYTGQVTFSKVPEKHGQFFTCHVYKGVYWTNHFFQGTRKHGHV